MNKTIAIDSGKYATKAITKNEYGTKKLIFRTKMDPTNEDTTTLRDSYIVTYKGKRYLIGNEAETIDFDKSKAKEIHKIATYTAISQLINSGDQVTLVAGCPLSIFNNVEDRKAYQNFMFDKGDIAITINKNTKHFTIDKIIICPEGSGIIYKNPMKFKNELVAIIDIGGLNTNCCIYNKLNPVRSSCFTTNLGANIMRNELKQKLNSSFADINIQDIQMEDILRKGFIKSHKEESKIIIQEYIRNHVKGILKECIKKGWDIKNLDFVFVGGGSLLFKEEILKEIPDAYISENGVFDNVEGFLEVGLARK